MGYLRVAYGVRRYSKDIALRYRDVSFNGKANLGWLIFDVDHPDAARAHERGRRPVPTVIIINRDNSHAHLAYQLSLPIRKSDGKAFAYCKDVRRGMRNRFGADPNYHGPLVKNPLHPRWDTRWERSTPYSLDELNAHLSFEDKKPDRPGGKMEGQGET